MRKIKELFQRWVQRIKDRHGKYVVIYLDGETRHRFTLADEQRANVIYEKLKQIITKTQKEGEMMLVAMYENCNIVRQYDTQSSKEFKRAQI